MTLALDARGVSKTFAGGRALDDFSLQVAPGEVHAVVGENGSGKSTFIKILAGFHEPDPGAQIQVGGRDIGAASMSAAQLGCRFVHQDLGLIESESVLDNLYLDMGFPSHFGTIRGRAARVGAKQMLAAVALDVDPETPVSRLTPAMKTGVALARAVRDRPDSAASLLVLDEPTATLPADDVRHLLDMIRLLAARGVGVVYVSHRLDEIFQIAQNVTVLRDGRVVARREVASLDRKRLVDLLVGGEFDEARKDSESLRPVDSPPVLTVNNLHAGTIDGVRLEVSAGTITGVAGITGSGRETLLGSLFGAQDRQGGTVQVAGTEVPPRRPDLAVKSGVAYLPPDRRVGGLMTLSAAENVSLSMLSSIWRSVRLSRAREAEQTNEWFEQLDVRPKGAIDRPLSTFSGGNQQKLLFAKWLRRSPVVFLLDEPTQGVDVAAKSTLHHELVRAAKNGAAVVISSSDPDELVALCHRVLVLRDGRIVAELCDSEINVAAISRAALRSAD